MKIKLGLNEDIICLGSGHSMIMGNLPVDKLDLNKVHQKIANEAAEGHRVDTDQFGLFDSSQPNYTSYYPDVTAEDLAPQDADFVYPVFRMLSETIVHKNVNPISFVEGGVLKQSMNKLVGQTVNVDHETAVGNAIGTVLSVEWQDSYKAANGQIIPGGINAVLKIDGKSNPRLARAVMMTPPSIHSNSVTIRFKWKKSHEDMDDNEFFNNLGTYDAKGEFVHRIVTEVIGFSETSLVSHGADPFAKKIENGKIVLEGLALEQASLSASNSKIDMAKRSASLSYKEEIQSFSAETILNSNNNNSNNNQKPEKQMKELLAKLATIAKIENASDITEDSFAEKFEEIISNASAANEEVTELKGKVSTLETELATAKESIMDSEELSALKSKAELADAKLAEVKDNAKKAYQTLKGEEASDAILSNIENSTPEVAEALLSEYTAELDKNHPLTCKDCSSVNLSRASHKAPAAEGSEAGEGNTKLSSEEIKKNFRKPKTGLMGIFKSDK